MKRLIVILVMCGLFLLPVSSNCLGPSISKYTATWDANTESDLSGYYLYWRTPTGAFADVNRIGVPKAATPTFDLRILNLPSGVYVIAVSAVDAEGNESGLSNEATWDASYPDSPKNNQVK